MTLVRAIFVVAIITAERLFTYYQLSCVHVNQRVNQTNYSEFYLSYQKLFSERYAKCLHKCHRHVTY